MQKSINRAISALAVFGLNLLYRLYKMLVSPLLGNRCRFYPSCSDYSKLAIEKHGWITGGWMSVKRLAKCHQFHPGGFDYVE